MTKQQATDGDLLDALLDSWNRNNTILVNLLRVLPEGGLDARVTPCSRSVGEMFSHMNYVRLVFLEEDAPLFAKPVPDEEWALPADRDQLAELLNGSAAAVREAVKGKLASGQQMDLHYDHPILFLQHMIWHEGYHHGQIKLALKAAGLPLDNKVAGPVTWRVWMNKRPDRPTG